MLNSRRRSKTVEDGRRWSKAILRLLRLRFTEARRVLLRVCGMPDYEQYVLHLRASHPGRAVPTEQQFFEEYLRARYEGGPTRCC
jgi:uncharacterized short protein YbdD (DUF466 family)